MRLAKQTIDPLWQCLCPAWSRGPLGSASARRIRPAPRHDLLRHSTQGRRHASSGSASAHQARCEVLDRRERIKSESNTQDTTSALYQHLGETAMKGQIQRCRTIAQHLVQEQREKPSVQLYNALIMANTSHDQGSAWHVMDLLEEMHAEGLNPDSGTCHAVLRVCAVHVDHLLRADTLDYMQKRWYNLSEAGVHDVIAGLLREGLLEQALERLDQARRDGVTTPSWLEDMAAYIFADAGELDEAFRLVQARYDSGATDTSATLWATLLDKASEARHLDATAFVWTMRVRQGYLNPSTGVCLNVLATAAAAGDATLGTEVFEHLGKRGTAFQPVHFELLITAYLSAEKPDADRALSVLTIMSLEELKPTALQTRPLFAYLRDMPDRVRDGFVTLRKLHESGRVIPIAALNLLIECHVEQGNLSEALKIYKIIHTFGPIEHGAQKSFADVETFNLLLKGCRVAEPPDAALAKFLVSELLVLRVMPTSLTYDRLILVLLAAAASARVRAGSASAPGDAIDAQSADAPLATPAEARSLAATLLPGLPVGTGTLQQRLDDAVSHFADMRSLDLMPRLGTLKQLCVELANARDERCWDVLQVAEDERRQIEGWEAKGQQVRESIESAWKTAIADGPDQVGNGAYEDAMEGSSEQGSDRWRPSLHARAPEARDASSAEIAEKEAAHA